MPAYTNNKSIDAYYNALKEPVKAQMSAAEADYKYNTNELQKTKEGQDAQAYRSLQRQLRTLPEEMAASGAQGGMVDSGLAYIKNRYLSGRNDRAMQYNTDYGALTRDYENTLTGLRGQLAQYEQMAKADKAELNYQDALNNAGGYTTQMAQPVSQTSAQPVAAKTAAGNPIRKPSNLMTISNY